MTLAFETEDTFFDVLEHARYQNVLFVTRTEALLTQKIPRIKCVRPLHALIILSRHFWNIQTIVIHDPDIATPAMSLLLDVLSFLWTTPCARNHIVMFLSPTLPVDALTTRFSKLRVVRMCPDNERIIEYASPSSLYSFDNRDIFCIWFSANSERFTSVLCFSQDPEKDIHFFEQRFPHFRIKVISRKDGLSLPCVYKYDLVVDLSDNISKIQIRRRERFGKTVFRCQEDPPLQEEEDYYYPNDWATILLMSLGLPVDTILKNKKYSFPPEWGIDNISSPRSLTKLLQYPFSIKVNLMLQRCARSVMSTSDKIWIVLALTIIDWIDKHYRLPHVSCCDDELIACMEKMKVFVSRPKDTFHILPGRLKLFIEYFHHGIKRVFNKKLDWRCGPLNADLVRRFMLFDPRTRLFHDVQNDLRGDQVVLTFQKENECVRVWTFLPTPFCMFQKTLTAKLLEKRREYLKKQFYKKEYYKNVVCYYNQVLKYAPWD